MCGVKIANRFGRPFPHSMERVELKDFEAGDHIVVERHYTYWHHMIVDKEEDVYIIHFHRSTGPSGSGSGICRNLFDTNDNDTYYRIIYKDEECLPPEKVVETAKKMMNEGGHSYNFVFNNCEHFANLCKTGKSICHQIWTLIEIFGKCSLSSILSFFVQTHRSRRSSKMHPNAAPDCEYKAKSTKAFAEYGAQFDPRLATIIALLVEIYLLKRDYADIKAKYNEEEKFSEVIKVIAKRVCAAVGSIVGDRFGFYYGNIKWSRLGVILGAWVLPVLGTIVLGGVGDFLAKVVVSLFEGKLEELVVTLFNERILPLLKSYGILDEQKKQVIKQE